MSFFSSRRLCVTRLFNKLIDEIVDFHSSNRLADEFCVAKIMFFSEGFHFFVTEFKKVLKSHAATAWKSRNLLVFFSGYFLYLKILKKSLT